MIHIYYTSYNKYAVKCKGRRWEQMHKNSVKIPTYLHGFIVYINHWGSQIKSRYPLKAYLCTYRCIKMGNKWGKIDLCWVVYWSHTMEQFKQSPCWIGMSNIISLSLYHHSRIQQLDKLTNEKFLVIAIMISPFFISCWMTPINTIMCLIIWLTWVPISEAKIITTTCVNPWTSSCIHTKPSFFSPFKDDKGFIIDLVIERWGLRL